MKHTAALFLLLFLAIYANAQKALQNYTYNFSSFSPLNPIYISHDIDSLTPDAFKSHPEYGHVPEDAQCDDCEELINKRTIDSRYFIKKGTSGRGFYVQKSYGPMHYFDHHGQLITIDAKLKPVQNEKGVFAALHQPIPVSIDLNEDYSSLLLENGYEFRFNHKTRLLIEYPDSSVYLPASDLSKYAAGDDGVINMNFWPGIDRKQFISKSSIETDYIILQALHLPDNTNIVIEEQYTLPEGYRLQSDKDKGFYTGKDWWNGDIVLTDNHNAEIMTIKGPKLFDSLLNNGPNRIGYQLDELSDNIYRFRIKISAQWLNRPERVYPVTIDPVVIGTDTFYTGLMGFKFSTCYDSINYCPYTLVVTVPGNSSLSNAYFDARYVSQIQGCGFATDCKKQDAWFKIIGPCGISPSQNGYWSCTQQPQGSLPGTCYGDTIPMFNTINCLAPSCPDHVISFELRNAQCSCILPGCDTNCHVMNVGTWRITIEARTLESNVIGSKAICFQDSAQLTAFGYWGVPPYTYSWSPGGQTSKSIKVSPNATTTYTCTVTDTCGITSQSMGTITINPLPVLNLTSTNAFCTGGTDGSATVSASSGTAPYTYKWNTSPQQNTSTATNLPGGTYTVTVTDSKGCKQIDSVIVGFDNLLVVSSTLYNATCPGVNDGRIDLNVDIGQAPYSFSWSNGDNIEDPQNLAPGNYDVTIVDNLGCTTIKSYTIGQDAAVSVDAGADQTIMIGTSVQLNANVSPAGSYTYLWTPSTGLSDPTIPNPMATPDTTTTYTLTVTSNKNNGCSDIDTITIIVLPDLDVPIPNAFSPNGDGLNDVFFKPGNYEIVNIQIFDRWGKIVYEGVQPWNGFYKNKAQPIGTYAFQVTLQFSLNDEEVIKKGNVTLIR